MKRSDLRIAVVDDTAVSRHLITEVLDWMEVFNYSTYNNGSAALAGLTANPVHMVISDFHMPDMDGLALLERVRRTPGLQRLGFIIVTGRADANMIANGRALGLNNLINKPFTREQLRRCIESVTGPLA